MWQIKYSDSSSKNYCIVCVIELWIEVCQHYMDLHLKTLIVLHFTFFVYHNPIFQIYTLLIYFYCYF